MLKNVTVKGGTLPLTEIEAITEKVRKSNPDKYISHYEITLDGGFVNVKYTYTSVPFERIRRITGYLVGGLDRFNDAKRAEETDRIKHAV